MWRLARKREAAAVGQSGATPSGTGWIDSAVPCFRRAIAHGRCNGNRARRYRAAEDVSSRSERAAGSSAIRRLLVKGSCHSYLNTPASERALSDGTAPPDRCR